MNPSFVFKVPMVQFCNNSSFTSYDSLLVGGMVNLSDNFSFWVGPILNRSYRFPIADSTLTFK